MATKDIFEQIYDLKRKEEKNSELTEITEDIFSKALDHFKKMHEKEENSSLDPLDKHRESNNLLRLINGLYQLRLKKLMEMAIWQSISEGMIVYNAENFPENEQEFLKEISFLFKKYSFKKVFEERIKND